MYVSWGNQILKWIPIAEAGQVIFGNQNDTQGNETNEFAESRGIKFDEFWNLHSSTTRDNNDDTTAVIPMTATAMTITSSTDTTSKTVTLTTTATSTTTIPTTTTSATTVTTASTTTIPTTTTSATTVSTTTTSATTVSTTTTSATTVSTTSTTTIPTTTTSATTVSTTSTTTIPTTTTSATTVTTTNTTTTPTTTTSATTVSTTSTTTIPTTTTSATTVSTTSTTTILTTTTSATTVSTTSTTAIPTTTTSATTVSTTTTSATTVSTTTTSAPTVSTTSTTTIPTTTTSATTVTTTSTTTIPTTTTSATTSAPTVSTTSTTTIPTTTTSATTVTTTSTTTIPTTTTSATTSAPTVSTTSTTTIPTTTTSATTVTTTSTTTIPTTTTSATTVSTTTTSATTVSTTTTTATTVSTTSTTTIPTTTTSATTVSTTTSTTTKVTTASTTSTTTSSTTTTFTTVTTTSTTTIPTTTTTATTASTTSTTTSSTTTTFTTVTTTSTTTIPTTTTTATTASTTSTTTTSTTTTSATTTFTTVTTTSTTTIPTTTTTATAVSTTTTSATTVSTTTSRTTKVTTVSTTSTTTTSTTTTFTTVTTTSATTIPTTTTTATTVSTTSTTTTSTTTTSTTTTFTTVTTTSTTTIPTTTTTATTVSTTSTTTTSTTTTFTTVTTTSTTTIPTTTTTATTASTTSTTTTSTTTTSTTTSATTVSTTSTTTTSTTTTTTFTTVTTTSATTIPTTTTSATTVSTTSTTTTSTTTTFTTVTTTSTTTIPTTTISATTVSTTTTSATTVSIATSTTTKVTTVSTTSTTTIPTTTSVTTVSTTTRGTTVTTTSTTTVFTTASIMMNTDTTSKTATITTTGTAMPITSSSDRASNTAIISTSIITADTTSETSIVSDSVATSVVTATNTDLSTISLFLGPIILASSVYNLTENESRTIDLSRVIISSRLPVTYEILGDNWLTTESYNFLLSHLRLNRSSGALYIKQAVGSSNSKYIYKISISNSVGTAFHTLSLHVPPSYTAQVQWQTVKNNKYLESGSSGYLQLNFTGNLVYLANISSLPPTLIVIQWKYDSVLLTVYPTIDGSFSGSYYFTPSSGASVINISAAHPSYRYSLSSVLIQDTVFIKSLSTEVSQSTLILYVEEVSSFSNLITIRNTADFTYYNISLELDIESQRCIDDYFFTPHSINAKLVPNQELSFSLTILANCTIDKQQFSTRLKESRFPMLTSLSLQIESVWNCQSKANCSSNGQCIANETCQCESQYFGAGCDQCESGSYNYPTCTVCPSCVHGNLTHCRSDAVEAGCQCFDDTRFFGPLCQYCQSGLYGSDCEPLTIVTSISPTSVLDLSNTLATIYGDNFNANMSYFCRLDYNTTIIASRIKSQQLTCLLPSHTAGIVSVQILFNGTQYLNPSLTIQYVPSCPTEGCVHGICALGSCLCQYPYFGTNCTSRPAIPSLSPLPNITVTEKASLTLNLTQYLGKGDFPLNWWLDAQRPTGITIASNDSYTALLLWTSAIASNTPYLITVNVKNQAMPTVARQTFYISVYPAYSVSIKLAQNFSQSVLLQTTRLLLLGRLYVLHSNYSLTLYNSSVSVWVDVNSQNRRYLPLIVAENGIFTTYYTPMANEYGTIAFGASHPVLKQIDDGPVRDQLTYFGLQLQTLATSTLSFRTGSVSHFSSVAKIINPTNLNVSNLIVSLLGPNLLANNYNLTLNCSSSVINLVIANGQCLLDLALQFNLSYIGQIGFQLSNGQINSLYLILNVNVLFDSPSFTVSPLSSTLTIARNSQQFITARLSNIGSKPSGTIIVRVPTDQNYVNAITPTISSIPVNGNATIIFSIQIPNSAPLSIVDLQSTIVDYENQLSTNIALRLIIVGSNSSLVNVTFAIEDELTTFVQGNPLVANATISFSSRNLRTQQIVTTNARGLVSLVLVADTYQITATATKHSSVTNLATIDLSSNGQVFSIFLPRQTVTYIWTVTPTQVPDVYTVILDANYEVELPIPSVVVTPATLNLDYLENNNVTQIDLTLTNYGLIRVDNVQVILPNTHPFLRFYPFVNGSLGQILANSSVIASFRVQRLVSSNRRKRSSDVTMCMQSLTVYDYDCSGTKQVESAVPLFTRDTTALIALCRTIPIVASLGGYFFSSSSDGRGSSASGDSTVVAPNSLYVTQPPPTINGQTPSPLPSIDGASTVVSDQANILILSIGCPNGPSCIINLFKCGLELLGNIIPEVKLFLCGVDISKALFLFAQKSEEATMAVLEAVLACLEELDLIHALMTVYNCYHDISESCFSNARRRSSDNSNDPAVIAAIVEVESSYNYLSNYFELLNETYGGGWWQNITDASSQWFTAFDRARSNDSELGAFISASEYSDLTTVEFSEIDESTFLTYYNSTMTVWLLNDTRTTSSYLHLDSFVDRLNQYIDDTKSAQISGYDNIFDPFQNARIQLNTAITASESRKSVCASVSIRILQRITFTRQGFNAHLELDNSEGDSAITNVNLDFIITSDIGSSQVLNHLFSIGHPTFDGSLTALDVNNTLDSGSSGGVNWLLIPYTEAAPVVAIWYSIGGNLSYVLDGEVLNIPLVPDTVLVQPSAQLDIAYFLQKNIIGPDPTLPLNRQQDAQPFILAVLISNRGYGTAGDFRMQSSQPEIEDNKKGLLIHFQMLSMSVNNKLQSSPVLDISLGDLIPFTTSTIIWQLLTTIKGQFSSFNATFIEKNPNGDPQLSLLDSLTSHSLIHLVSLDLFFESGNVLSDGLDDYLVDDVPDSEFIPDTVFSSTNATLAFNVYHILAFSYVFDSGMQTVNVTVTPDGTIPVLSYIYVRLSMTALKDKAIVSSMRTNYALNITCNTWLSETNDNGQETNFLHIFDRLVQKGESSVYQVKLESVESNSSAITFASTIASTFPFSTDKDRQIITEADVFSASSIFSQSSGDGRQSTSATLELYKTTQPTTLFGNAVSSKQSIGIEITSYKSGQTVTFENEVKQTISSLTPAFSALSSEALLSTPEDKSTIRDSSSEASDTSEPSVIESSVIVTFPTETPTTPSSAPTATVVPSFILFCLIGIIRLLF